MWERTWSYASYSGVQVCQSNIHMNIRIQSRTLHCSEMITAKFLILMVFKGMIVCLRDWSQVLSNLPSVEITMSTCHTGYVVLLVDFYIKGFVCLVSPYGKRRCSLVMIGG